MIKTLYKSQIGLRIGEIKKILCIPRSTLGSCIKRLKIKGFVNYEPYHEVHLTKEGVEIAKELNRHSRLLELLLYHELGLSPEVAHDEGEKFSLLFSCDTINKICEKYDHPKSCPCGELILSSSECSCREK